ncbi:recombinase family protein [Mucilaginibacter sp. SP1R1]|uniref:recombinase family protein n=1 Tax=Mucilaginibacter sp. SP1R1 TaxID=2723091 RepID=UPI001610DC64|nr:recombinase family protein [Mucilaginibacter sp. SP1R1]MBB6147464.1 DNA invertase Pin-like site-specific DNA recombinase [Mucilaginibacter sp. SP1R1]
MNKKIKILYARVSTSEQNLERQTIDSERYLLKEETCSGAIPFFERPVAREILKLVNKGEVEELAVTSLDRLSRDLSDLLKTVKFFNERKIPIHFISQGIRTLDANGNENPIGTLIIQVLGIIAQMERSVLLERQKQGILIAKTKGVYKGRKSDTKEDVVKFLSKPKNKAALEYIKKGNLKLKEISILSGVHINTLTKIKKLGLQNAA